MTGGVYPTDMLPRNKNKYAVGSHDMLDVRLGQLLCRGGKKEYCGQNF